MGCTRPHDQAGNGRLRFVNVILDDRMALRGLGIATFVDRLVEGFAAHESVSLTHWRASGGWTRRGKLATLGKSGLFDASPRLDPRTHAADTIHYVSNIGSVYPGRNSVFTVHDLLYRRYHRRRDRLFGFLLESSLPRVGRVVAISARTRIEIEQAFPRLGRRVEVIPHGMRKLAAPPSRRRHVLAFGGGEDPRKRTDLMIAAYSAYRLTTPDPLPLVVLARAGLTDPQTRQLRDLDAVVVGQATASEADALVAGAAALIYTTTAEGFGLPVLEAAEVGTPVVIDASAVVAAEVLGPHCYRVDDLSPRGWAAMLRTAIAQGPIYDALELPGWDSVAGRYLEIYREVSG